MAPGGSGTAVVQSTYLGDTTVNHVRLHRVRSTSAITLAARIDMGSIQATGTSDGVADDLILWDPKRKTIFLRESTRHTKMQIQSASGETRSDEQHSRAVVRLIDG
jgi:hypothetical protein